MSTLLGLVIRTDTRQAERGAACRAYYLGWERVEGGRLGQAASVGGVPGDENVGA